MGTPHICSYEEIVIHSGMRHQWWGLFWVTQNPVSNLWSMHCTQPSKYIDLPILTLVWLLIWPDISAPSGVSRFSFTSSQEKIMQQSVLPLYGFPFCVCVCVWGFLQSLGKWLCDGFPWCKCMTYLRFQWPFLTTQPIMKGILFGF